MFTGFWDGFFSGFGMHTGLSQPYAAIVVTASAVCGAVALVSLWVASKRAGRR